MRDFHLPGRSPVYATNGMCATSHPLAAKIAIQMLESGGNAVDAAIAGAVLLGIAEPQMTGIGGDCFALIAEPGRDVVAVNGSGRAPAAIDAGQLRADGHRQMPLRHGAAVTVPGAIDAFCQMSADYGKMGLADVLAPTIPYAEEGIPVSDRVAFDWTRDAETLSGTARNVYLPGGTAPAAGTLFRAPMQAEVLRRVAKDGRSAFYEGEIAEDMVASLNMEGGTHTLADFAETRTTYDTPVSGHYGGYELVEHPPNGQGATAILMANILSHFDIASMDPAGTLRAHMEAEAAKLAYDARNRFLADADHVTRLEHMLSSDTAEALAALIDPKRAMDDPRTLSGAIHKDTIYITVVDRDRMAVSLIYSIFHGFGSGIASEKFGILFQNRGAGFSLQEGHANEAGPHKRPMHTIIPAMLKEDGAVVMPFGVMGGAYQPAGHARFLSNIADFGMSPQEAIDAPRSFPDAGTLSVERGYAAQVRQDLAEMGHAVSVPDRAIGGAQAIRIHPGGVLEGGSDPRKDGCALGY